MTSVHQKVGFLVRLFFPILLLLISLSSSSNANSSGVIYKACKPYADRAFKAETADDVSCASYFRGVAESGAMICSIMGNIVARPEIPEERRVAYEKVRVSSIGSFGRDELQAAIQLFVNEMASSPEKWQELAVLAAHSSLRKVAPCE